MQTLHQPADNPPQPRHRPPLPPAHWPVIVTWLVAHGLTPWVA